MGGKPFGTTPIGSGTHRGALADKGEDAHPNEAVTERHTVGSVALMKGEAMREIIVRYNDGNDHMAVRGGEYVRDYQHGEWEEKETFRNGDDEPIIEEWQSAMCSVCHKYHTTPYMYYFNNYNFCPNCGADMRKGADDE